MSAAAIIERARNLGVSLRAEGDKIKARGPRPAVEQILPVLRTHKPELLAVLAKPRLDPNESSGHWLIVRAPERVEMYFNPDVCRAELAQRFPGALLVPLPDTTDPLSAELPGAAR